MVMAPGSSSPAGCEKADFASLEEILLGYSYPVTHARRQNRRDFARQDAVFPWGC